ncbi:MAG: hypothetical protein ABIP39_05055 [Polyangiaceae bacterium]
MTFRTSFAATSLVALLLGACSSTITATNPNGVSATDVNRCKSSCDKMKFFDCASADEQAKCYNDCDVATINQIQIFTGCADNSICDPACRTTIEPKPSGGGTPTGGGASASSCGTACDKLVSCSLIPVGAKADCLSQCQMSAYQYQIDCVNNQTCDKVKSVCGNTTGGATVTGSGDTDAGSNDSFKITQCQQACDSANFFSCITATQHSNCRTLCSSAAADPRDSYTSCQNGAGGDCTKSTDCYTVFSQ